MPITKLRPTFTLEEDRLSALRALLPEAFRDGELDPATLLDILGAPSEDDEEAPQEVEHFGLTWPGKREARRAASLPPQGTLVPDPGAGVDEDDTRNLFIEGDNLEVLKLLQKSYAGRVKLIYIDPPYNTGNDFIYPDDYSEPLDAYLRRTGQADAEGLLTTNTRAGGRFHSNWLSMMYPRLRLARQLLCEDGLIFVSIDDSEAPNLRLLLNEIFGEENFIAQIVWRNVYGGGPKVKQVVMQHEYTLCYANSTEAVGAFDLPPEPQARKRYTERDVKYATRGPYFTQPLATTSMDSRPNLRYPIHWQGEEIWPEKQWQWSRERVEEAIKNDELVFRKQENGGWSVRYKQYLMDETGNERGSKLYSVLIGPYTQEGTAEVKQLFGDGKVFPFPKPSSLIKRFVSYTWKDKDAIILDFFSGSCTTAHAVLELNREDGGNRRFIMVQLPEPTGNPEFPTIADIGRERIRRVIAQMRAADAGKLDLRENEDLGFRAFRLARSNFKPWRDLATTDAQQIAMAFDDFTTPLVADWTPAALLTEILLLEGFPLDSVVARQDAFTHNAVSLVASEARAHRLWLCLDAQLAPETVAQLALPPDDLLICLDSALTDETKMRLADAGNVHTI